MSSVEKNPKQFKEMNILQAVNSTFREALDYRTYRLDRTMKNYDRHARKIGRMETSLEISMKTQ